MSGGFWMGCLKTFVLVTALAAIKDTKGELTCRKGMNE